MKSSELIIGQVYEDITDKNIPLLYEGKIEKNVNNGFNDYSDFATFKTVRNDKNKNWNFPDFIEKRFCEVNGNSTIRKFEQ